jgi:hypothetical protein
MEVCSVKKSTIIALILVLVLSLALPTAAFAKKGGVPANGKDKAANAQKADKDKGPKDKDRGADEALEVAEAPLPDGEVTLPPGWETAYASVKSNLDRMQSAVDAGFRKQVPPGLQRVVAKFMERLGIEAAEEGDELPDGDDLFDGSDESSGTVETSGTVEPTETVETSL